jgi:hypothetical protein
MSVNSPSQSTDSTQSVLLTLHERLAQQSATCKLVSLVLAVSVLAFVSGRSSSAYLFLPVAPLLLTMLLDAAYAARANQTAKLMQRLALGESKAAVRPWEMIGSLMTQQGLNAALPTLGGVLFLSVWPFYLALGSLMILLGTEVLTPKPLPILPRNPVATGFPVSAPTINKYPANGINPSGQFQGVKPPQPLRPGSPTANGTTAPLPSNFKGGQSFPSKQPQNPTKSNSVFVPPLLKQPAVPTTPTPVIAPRITPQSATPVAAPPIVKPSAVISNDGVKQP